MITPDEGNYASSDDCQKMLDDMVAMGSACGRCRYFRKNEEATYFGKFGFMRAKLEGFCHRFPPSHVDDDETGNASRPFIHHDEWCGEFVDAGMPSLDDVCSKPNSKPTAVETGYARGNNGEGTGKYSTPIPPTGD